MKLHNAHIHIQGIVQGVGFRPFVYSLSNRLSLTGWVRNTSAGVEICVDGPRETLESFLQALRTEAPALARIDDLRAEWGEQGGFSSFEILHSDAIPSAFQPISPDVSICPDCLRELFDPGDRRYRYPFINCTNCGPRFTIIQDIPYDRPNTTMSAFPMCPDCAAEYADPGDRRFHAQPVACAVCGPTVWLEYTGETAPASHGDAAIRQARDLLRAGKILAVKGLGGFHLACDATDPAAVGELRRRKLRVDKPFALMISSSEVASVHCWLSPLELGLLETRQRPVVIARRRPESPVASEVAPGQNTIGLMLPYTPLHYLLFADPEQQPVVFNMPPLVMTSGNLSEEPICTANDEARRRLAPLADAFLMHDREIHVRCDDSVVRMFPAVLPAMRKNPGAAVYPVRRSRGYAPDPLRLAVDAPPLLATGAELKNTFCLARGRYAFLSHHIGDLENYETLRSFEEGVAHFERLFRVQPQAIAYDLHPDYLATRYALERAERQGLAAIGVQHHHAHIAACMAENGLDSEQQVIGVAFDGTGYGEDGAIWGGEFLIAGYASCQRAAHLAYTRLPGGDKAVREPWRTALAWLHTAGIEWDADLPPVRYASSLAGPSMRPLDVLSQQLHTGLNAPLTSSMGRLFDAVAALAGLRAVVNYEAQAAIELEALVDGREPGYYACDLRQDKDGMILDPARLLHGVIADLRSGEGQPVIAARFHSGVARMVCDTCLELRRRFNLTEVVLSGGVWQNTFLLALTAGLLQQERFNIYIHRQVPANDGGLALGQAVVAIARLNS